jgi:hypothetical protein
VHREKFRAPYNALQLHFYALRGLCASVNSVFPRELRVSPSRRSQKLPGTTATGRGFTFAYDIVPVPEQRCRSALSENSMATRQHRIGSDARSKGENRVLMTRLNHLGVVAPTQMSRFCAAFGGSERAWLRRGRSSLYRLNTAWSLRLASAPFPTHRMAIGFSDRALSNGAALGRRATPI